MYTRTMSFVIGALVFGCLFLRVNSLVSFTIAVCNSIFTHVREVEVTFRVEQDTVATLEVRRAELTMETDGALADISAQHEQEVQNQSKSSRLYSVSPMNEHLRWGLAGAVVVLDVLDVCEYAPKSVEEVSTQKLTSTGCVVGGGGGSDDGVTGRRVEDRRAKLTDVRQPRKNS